MPWQHVLESLVQFIDTPVGGIYKLLIALFASGWIGYQVAEARHEFERRHEENCVFCAREGHERYHQLEKETRANEPRQPQK